MLELRKLMDKRMLAKVGAIISIFNEILLTDLQPDGPVDYWSLYKENIGCCLQTQRQSLISRNQL